MEVTAVQHLTVKCTFSKTYTYSSHPERVLITQRTKIDMLNTYDGS
jgi:hypothetical protein